MYCKIVDLAMVGCDNTSYEDYGHNKSSGQQDTNCWPKRTAKYIKDYIWEWQLKV